MPYDCLEYDSMFIRNCSPKGEGGTLENLETDLPLCMGTFLLQKITPNHQYVPEFTQLIL